MREKGGSTGPDSEVSGAFVDAAVHVLSSMTPLMPRPKKSYLHESRSTGEYITGLIGLMGDFEGTLVVSFSRPCIQKIVEDMAGKQDKGMDKLMLDTVGEMTNIISGDARSRLGKIGYHIVASLPTVVRGERSFITHVSDGSSQMFVPFDTEAGEFCIDLVSSS